MAALPTHLQELMRRRLAGEDPGLADSTAIPTVPREGDLALSPAQERLWFLYDFEPDSVEYNVVRAIRLTGELDVGALRFALDRLVERHEPLRTTFDSVAGSGVQVVHPHTANPLPVTDLTGLPDRQREATVDETLLAEVQRPFDLRQGPLFRSQLLRLEPTEYVLVLSVHHIAGDGWSMGVLVDELNVLYAARLRGESDGLPDLVVQYADFAAWQRDRLAEGALEEKLDYWRQRLDGLSPLELPTDRPRPSVRDSAGALHVFEVSESVTTRVKELGRQAGTTLYMALVAAAQILLARYSGRTDIAVGTSTSGRDRPELEKLIGFFVNTVVLRVDVDESKSFAELLDTVRTTALDAFGRAEVPFQRLVEALRPERDPSRPPLVQAMVNLHNADEGTFRLPGLRAADVQPPALIAKLDLTLDFAEHDGGLTGYLEYSTELFELDTIRRLADNVVALLTAVAADPHRPLGEIALVSAAERRILDGWHTAPGEAAVVPGEPAAAPERLPGVLELFDEQCRRAPNAQAVRHGDRELTYAELAERSARLASHLAKTGVGPEVVVGIVAERGIELVVGMLAVLRAGGAYLPLDPKDPADRLGFVLADSGAAVVLTLDRLRDRLSASTVPVICLDTDAATIDAEAAAPLPAPPRPQNPAYLIYTSGSTGRPKGVLIEHRQLARYLDSCARDHPGLGGVALLHSSISFDLTVTTLWGTLSNGGAILVGDLDVRTPATPPDGQRATFVKITPSHLPILLDLPSECSPVAELVIGGEALLAENLEQWRAKHPDVVVHNEYGPTEATVGCVVFRAAPSAELPPGAVSIGRPMSGLRAYVLDDRLRPVPIGVVGELYVAGPQLARGYHGRPATTSERFVPDPFGAPGERMYRTGDLARRNGTGDLEYRGRADEQVKIRGYRIELGEVESQLATHPGVAQVAATAREDRPGDRRLVAYVVPAAGVALDAGQLRDHLAQRVPGHLVPTAFVTLTELPLAPSGKVDRRALPAPEQLAEPAPRGRVAPRDDVEATLLRIWAEVLGMDPERLGIEDNFFDHGGDSIQAILVVWQAKQAGLELTSKQMFLRQTVAELAPEVLSKRLTESIAPTPTATEADVPLTPIQHWFFTELAESREVFNQSTFVELAPDTDAETLQTALTAVLDHHDAFALRFETGKKGWRQFHSTGRRSTFDRVNLAETSDAEVDTAIGQAIAEAQRGFALSDGPLVKALYLDLGAERLPRLFLTAHHLVIDGVSWRIVLADLETAYRRLRAAEPVAPGPKTTPFAEWAHRLRGHAGSGAFDHELAHWHAVEQAVTATAPLPVDRSGDNTVASVRTSTIRLDAEHTTALLRRVPELYRTRINDVLLAALGRVVADWTGDARIALEMEGHGRQELFDDLDVGHTIGWFTSHFPVALSIPDEREWGGVLKSVKEQLRALPGDGIGYGALRYLRDTASEADRLHGVQPQIAFNYLGRFDTGSATADGLYRGWSPNPAIDRSPTQQRQALLEVTGYVQDTELEFRFGYSAEVHDEATIAELARRFQTALAEIVEHCATPGAGGATPSDFPLARLDQATVDRIVGDGTAVEDVYPLTPMQSGLLFHSLDSPGGGVYVSHFGIGLDGVTDPDILAEAWQRVARRTPTLRTSVVWEDVDEPVQVVHVDAPIPVAHHDLRHLDEAERDQASARLWELCKQQGLDLSVAPLARLTLVRLTESRVQVMLSSHHMLLDGWSFSDVLSEVFQQYALLQGDQSVILKTRRPYRDYVRWLAEQDAPAAQAHWRRTLHGFATPTPLPTNRAVERAHASQSSRKLDIRLSPERSQAVYEFARQTRVTVNTLVQGAWAMLLSRYSGESDVCFGATVFGRPGDLLGSDSIVGLFINTIPVRVQVPGDAEVRGWLQELQARQAESQQYDHVSLAQVQGYSDVPGGTNLFDSIVVFKNYPYDPDAAARFGLHLRDFLGDEHTNYPLILNAYTQDELNLTLGYDPELFDQDTITGLAGHLEALLGAIATNPENRVGALPMLTAEQRHRLVVECNDTAVDYPGGLLHELVAEQAARTPDADAMVFDGARLTYRELDERANRLARYLVDTGVRPDTLVGICLERGPELAIALLGVLKAGAASVPLDPGYPDNRLRLVLRDAECRLVLTQDRLAHRLTATEATVLRIDTAWSEIAARPATPPAVEIGPDQLAYAIYTSGSTGTPKGVVVSHRAIVNRLRWMQRDYPLGADDRVLQKTSAGFDVSVWELFGPLIAGATLVPAGQDEGRDPARLVALMARERVTTVHFVPPLLAAVLAEPGIAECLSVRRVFSGGEALTSELADRVHAAFPGVRLANIYGPSETAVDVTHWTCTPGERRIPIGVPVGNTRIHLLDRFLQPVPIGVPGELYIAGVQLARGYHRRPELTATRFVPDPFGAPGDRLYRSGDLARRRADGALEFLGRTDDQVKLRGYRIELGEVAAALAAHPGVGLAHAVIREDRPGDRRLVAYLTGLATPSPSVAQLRDFLTDRVPSYLVPSAFVVLESLPRNASGKVDRHALPAPESAATPAQTSRVAPRTPVEEALAEIWAEVLGLTPADIGIDDDFFERGGDSILGILVISRMRARLGVSPSPRQLFDTPTLGGLATAIEGRAELPDKPTADTSTEPAAIPVIDRTGPLALSHAQQRLWFHHQFDAASAEYTTILGLRLRGAFDLAAMESALTELIARHEPLRTTFDTVDGRGVQLVRPPAAVTLTPIDLTLLAAPERQDAVDRILRDQAATPFDLRAAPALRPVLIRVDDDEHVLALVMHHIITDGWSNGVLTAELAAHYASAVRGLDSTRDPLPLQYADFAAWQRDQLIGPAMAEHLDYWKRELDGIVGLALPVDRPRPAVRSSEGDSVYFELPPELNRLIKSMATGQDATLFMVLVASIQLLLARHCGQRDIAVGTVTAGRNRSELADLIGVFVNTTVLRSTVDESRPFAEFLAEVRGTVLGALEHDEIPFEWLVDELRPTRDPSRNALAEVMVVLGNTIAPSLEFPGIDAERMAFGSTDVSHDLSFDFGEKDGALHGAISFSTALFDRSTVERMRGHLVAILTAIAADPTVRPAELPLLTEPERAQLLTDFNGAPADFPTPRLVHETFTAQARRTPDAIAVSAGETELTFAELDERADLLAGRLRALGVRPGLLVGVCLERGPQAVIALLAVLKAGGAFVPLDPDYPARLVTQLVADAAAPVVLTETHLAHRVAEAAGTVLCLDSDEPDPVRPQPAAAEPVTPNDLAYVVYTSGSTGRPKGVMIEHRNVHHIINAWDTAYGLSGTNPRCLSVSSFGVDLFFADFLLSAMFGGTMVICPAEVVTDPPALVDLMEHTETQVMVTVPALAKALSTELAWQRRSLPALRVLAVGSEGWPATDGGDLVGTLGRDTIVVNAYGATETTVDSTLFRVDAEPIGSSSLVPVGRPMANTSVYVVDPDLRPVPIGVAGELYIGGDGIARGYWNRADLTAQRFRDDPFAGGTARMYRTGDIARWRVDGNLEFLGRVDDQLKVRGYRIEPAEVEAALAAHPDIAAASATGWTDDLGRSRLVGYVVPHTGRHPDSAELRGFVADRLPGYAVPSALVTLDALPLTPSGTVDRRALPRPADSTTADEHLAPRNDLERRLVELWAEVLGLEPARVGVRDNFFDLGGDSILSIQLAFAARRAGVGFTSKDLFLHQTIERLAPVAGRDSEAVDRSVVGGEVPLTPVQHEYLSGEPTSPHHFTQSVQAAMATDLDPAALDVALTALVRHHDALRMRFEHGQSGWRQHHAPADVESTLVRHDLTGLDPAAQRAEIDRLGNEATASLDLAAGPILRTLLFDLGADRRPILFLAIHHLVVDAVSWSILLGDLDTAYRQAVGGDPVDLGAKTTSFLAWAQRLAGHVQDGGLDHELPHWTGLPHPTPLPADAAVQQAAARESVRVELSASETDTLLRGAPAVFRTRINDVLLAALSSALCRWTGQDGLLIDLEGHGREELFDDIDLSRTVGWFTTVFPVLLPAPIRGVDAEPDATDWRQTVRATRRSIREIPGKGLGYGALRFLGGPDTPGAALADRPNPEVLFNYLGRVAEPLPTDRPMSGSASNTEDTAGGLVHSLEESAALNESPDATSDHALSITGGIRGGRIVFDWAYSPRTQRATTIERVAGDFLGALRQIARELDSPADPANRD
ncbi:non-ribosomal peptide synthase/amino acid adenylation enzyme [Actinoalloteichus hymeniacidonis]|uniref:Non-ribosomal peptide synthase/amino acid adenylation enzyme n=2 Tax=Actinoalloteichus hymeniacidonis TaxID=340345 RepID=A0AAC9MZ71_9PSEU|nr:non-ribosomal peptide synthase/amino acid adenylation enzyme [Actinoalloteichus hymeniacidonis]